MVMQRCKRGPISYFMDLLGGDYILLFFILPLFLRVSLNTLSDSSAALTYIQRLCFPAQTITYLILHPPVNCKGNLVQLQKPIFNLYLKIFPEPPHQENPRSSYLLSEMTLLIAVVLSCFTFWTWLFLPRNVSVPDFLSCRGKKN